ncbi:hypothetical protein SAMN05421803_14918 [Nocardiopsis flavescens]|uniref:Uncharacterized protein n=1 Tax=Nocardiopsis flavescens TaxID=758803 RepID=A0A1M6WRT5_9ACTN|nr:hypothetical protein [Nocardiopsis flavescens]SHK96443.1 hypothetical protein SAMN05421803_14918 [Nocardiopsis flavescens]
MDVTWQHPEGEGDPRIGPITLTPDAIEALSPTLGALVTAEEGGTRLGRVLGALVAPGSTARAGAEEIGRILWALALMGADLPRALDRTMVAARDHYGLSWGTIATSAGVPRATVRRRIATARRTLAEAGIYVDGAGEHTPRRARGPLHTGGVDPAEVRRARAVAEALSSPGVQVPHGAVPWMQAEPADDAGGAWPIVYAIRGEGPMAHDAARVAAPRLVALVGGPLDGQTQEAHADAEGGWTPVPGGRVDYHPHPEDPDTWMCGDDY